MHVSPEAHPQTTRRGSNLDDLRRRNLSTVLDLVHLNRSMTRADIARSTGLNRSTVMTIVNELASLQLITATEPIDTKKIGRPSSVIVPSPHHLAVAVNPDTDACIIGIIGLGGQVMRTVRYPNEHIPSPQEMVNIVAAVLQGMLPSLADAHEVVGVGLGVPGLVNSTTGVVTLAPHLGWRDEPVAQMLSDAVGLPVFAGNDASCGIVAEASFGAGVGDSEIVFLNGGASGIGGGVIIGGRQLGGVSGYGGEFGHTLVNSAGVRCHCGAVGCLETEVTRGELLRVAGVADSTDLRARLTAAYQSSDEARAEVERQIDYLAVAIRNIVNTLNPGLVILGGFLSILHALDGERLESVVRATALAGAGAAVRIVASQGRSNLLLGAGQLVLESLLNDPTSARRGLELSTGVTG